MDVAVEPIADDLLELGSRLLSKELRRITPVTTRGHIPHEILSDVLEGFRDPVVLRHWEDHTRSCSSCQANVRAFTAPGLRIDPYDMLLNSERMRRTPRPKTTQLQKWLREGVKEFGPTFRVSAGEANVEIYDESMERAFRSALDEALDAPSPLGGAVPHLAFVTGPILSIVEGSGPRRERSVIPKLAEHPLFDLYFSRHRQSLHFRVGSTEQRLYCETPHPVVDMDREACFVVDGDMVVVSLFSRRFECLLSDPLVHKCEKGSGDVTRRFGFMTVDEMERLKVAVTERGLDYDTVLDHELFAIAEDLEIEYRGDAH